MANESWLVMAENLWVTVLIFNDYSWHSWNESWSNSVVDFFPVIMSVTCVPLVNEYWYDVIEWPGMAAFIFNFPFIFLLLLRVPNLLPSDNRNCRMTSSDLYCPIKQRKIFFFFMFLDTKCSQCNEFKFFDGGFYFRSSRVVFN